MPSTFNFKDSQSLRLSSRLATIKRTKENIVFFRVFTKVSNKEVTKKTLLKRFTSFGKIKDLTIVEQNEKFCCEIANYKPTTAAHLLRARFFRLDHTHFMMKSSLTWKQPLQVRNYDEKGPSSSTTALSVPPYTDDILLLNDYCLAIIFNYLDLNSQLSFSVCHGRLEQIFIDMICPRSIPQQLTIDALKSQFTDWELWQFFKTAGQYIKGIKITKKFYIWNLKSNINICQMINNFCTNVERVQLIERRYFGVFLLKFFNASLLTEIELYWCDVVDSDFETLANCPNLNSLGLARNTEFAGDLLRNLIKLQRLSLYNCRKITLRNLIDACKNMNLKYLDIRCTKSGLSKVLQYCQNLETLKMTIYNSKDVEQIMTLKHLKSLELNECIQTAKVFNNYYENLEALKLYSYGSNILPNIIGRFQLLRTLWLRMGSIAEDHLIIKAISRLQELVELKLESAYTLHTNHLIPVVQNCLKLKRLCLSDFNVSNDFIYSCFKILENRYALSKPATLASLKPLTIFLSGINITNFFIKSFNEKINNKFVVLKKFINAPPKGLLSNDLPFDVTLNANDEEEDSLNICFFVFLQ